jgi:hypothetical protein
MKNVTSFWRTLFFAHLATSLVVGLLYLKFTEVLNPNFVFLAMFWLGAPWSAAGQYLPSVDGVFTFLILIAPVINIAMLARRAFRRELYAAVDRPDNRPPGELRRLWWLVVMPFFAFLFLYWNNGFLTEGSRHEGIAIAQALVLVNCLGLFLPRPSLRQLTIWIAATLPVVWLLGTHFAIGKLPLAGTALSLPPWLGSIGLLWFLSIRWRRRQTHRVAVRT